MFLYFTGFCRGILQLYNLAERGLSLRMLIDILEERCVRALLSPSYSGLTGKTVSANFDPWGTDEFRRHLGDIALGTLHDASHESHQSAGGASAD